MALKSGDSSHRARKATCSLWVLLVELNQIRSVPRHKSFLLPIAHEVDPWIFAEVAEAALKSSSN